MIIGNLWKTAYLALCLQTLAEISCNAERCHRVKAQKRRVRLCCVKEQLTSTLATQNHPGGCYQSSKVLLLGTSSLSDESAENRTNPNPRKVPEGPSRPRSGCWKCSGREHSFMHIYSKVTNKQNHKWVGAGRENIIVVWEPEDLKNCWKSPGFIQPVELEENSLTTRFFHRSHMINRDCVAPLHVLLFEPATLSVVELRVFQQKIHIFGTWSKNVCPALDPRLGTERFSPAVKANKNSTSTTPERPGHVHGRVHGRTWHSRLWKATCANMPLSLSAVRLCLSSFSLLLFFFFFVNLRQAHQCGFINKRASLWLRARTHTHAQLYWIQS